MKYITQIYIGRGYCEIENRTMLRMRKHLYTSTAIKKVEDGVFNSFEVKCMKSK